MEYRIKWSPEATENLESIMIKSAAFRIRIEPPLDQQLLTVCKAQHLNASKVLIDFMHNFVKQAATGIQAQLFHKEIE